MKTVSNRCKAIYACGSWSKKDTKSCRDIDMTLIPNSWADALFLTLYVQLLLMKFMLRRIKVLPDVFILETNFYDEFIRLK